MNYTKTQFTNIKGTLRNLRSRVHLTAEDAEIVDGTLSIVLFLCEKRVPMLVQQCTLIEKVYALIVAGS